MEGFLLLATIYLTAAVIAVPIAARLGLGSVLGYLLAGIVIGPVLGLVGSETQDLQHFAEFGVVMMLFLIGLELDPRALWDMRDRLLGMGGMQIVLTTAVVMAGAMQLGLVWQTALAVGMILALSSTAIVLQTLTEKRLTRTPGGRATFAVLLTQDIAVIPMLALLPLLAVKEKLSIAPDGSLTRHATQQAAEGHGSAISVLAELPGWGLALVTLGAVVAIILVGHYLTRPLFRFIHASRLREMFTVVALLIVVAIALLMIMVGLSPALGTFLAGVVLANSEFRHDLESSIEPFKGLLLGLFFMTVGAGINMAVLFADLGQIIGLTLALMIAKGLILYGLAVLFKLRAGNKWLFTLALAQAGEFGFVLVSFALQTNVLTQSLGQTLLLIIAMSMLLTPLFFILHDFLSRRVSDTSDSPRDFDKIDEQHPIIIAGIGRFGQVVNRMLQMSGFRATVLDHDLPTIELMRKFGFKSFFGDPTRPELLHAAGLDNAKVLVAALDDSEANTRLVRYARRERPDLSIVARAKDRVHVYELYRAGADHIVREMFDSSLRAGRYVLEDLGLTDFEANEMETAFYKHDREALRELAELWKPGVPLDQNQAYLARASELNKELETALVRQEVASTEEITEGAA
ncbi:MAG: potassium transporter [Confluentimicrobium sp.]|jgi:CPA2 family monovalent cation:H+ antiporter-2|uniref:monovalent cation:proton antiporter-2 (CPA2) family protein n=1 Tax=Actibacterium sp. TaxID=1872125 RepID=UPI00050F3B20|nr:monovalent cation:proton antiporter-2 (CPA2) family protein [Actibacterium sp.]KGB82253.1 potassium transporter [Rhodovulum sp. NI22]MBC56049.1 potassium transporter [Actibacterium sp.]MDY6858719.1 monovalent cation:proton antiporter-2 (CPA2) family protein [Pseudomonadota bacterium]